MRGQEKAPQIGMLMEEAQTAIEMKHPVKLHAKDGATIASSLLLMFQPLIPGVLGRALGVLRSQLS